jgi:OPT family oligopeptide transporter
MQSTASAAGYSTGGTLVTAFGAMLLISGEHYPWYVAVAWTFVTACLGTVIAIPMKRQMIDREQLPFPSGIAAAETLKALYGRGAEAMRKAWALVVSLVVGMALAFLRTAEWGWLEKLKIKIPELIPFSGSVRGVPSSTLPVFGFEPSLLLIGAGMITGLRVSLSMLAGSCLLYFAIGPALIQNDNELTAKAEQAAVANPDAPKPILSVPPVRDKKTGEVRVYPLTRWSLWAGTSLMVMASLTSVAMQWRTIARAFRRSPGGSAGSTANASADIQVPAFWFWVMFLPVAAASIFIEKLFFDIGFINGAIAVALSVVLSLVACRATGETDTTPVGAMGKIAQLLYAVLSPKNIQINLMTASIAANGASSSADLLTDLKSGYLLGASPRKQFLAQFAGVFFGTAAIVPAWYLMIPDAKTLENYNPPATNMWKAVAELLTKGVDQLPTSALWGIAIGAALGILLPSLERLLPAKAKPFLPSAMGLGLGWVVPFANSFSFAIGAVIAWVWERASKKSAEDYNVPIASGFVAGESLMAAGVAMFQTVSDMLAAKPAE